MRRRITPKEVDDQDLFSSVWLAIWCDEKGNFWDCGKDRGLHKQSRSYMEKPTVGDVRKWLGEVTARCIASQRFESHQHPQKLRYIKKWIKK